MADDEGFPIPPHRNVYDLNSKIMLTAIISLSVVVLLVIMLHIYARCVLRRQVRRRRQAFLGRIRSTGLTTSGEPPKTGLDPMVINSLPIFVFKQTSDDVGYYHDDDDMSTECAVCLSTLEDEEMARFLPNCKHTFHAECIDKWLASQSTCPICRMEVEPRLQPEPREGPAIAIVDSAAADAPPTAQSQSLERVNSTGHCMEGTSDAGIQLSSTKVINCSSSRLSSFRRMLSRERSMRRGPSCEENEDDTQDLERQ
ncbi:zinc finger protein [Theobroma cacao]|nr:zinc finger protein [Theobroma cacao]